VVPHLGGVKVVVKREILDELSELRDKRKMGSQWQSPATKDKTILVHISA
jgi:hypothetical protein